MLKNKNIKIALIWTNPYSGNLGVGALAYSSLVLIKDVLEERNISGDFVLIGCQKVCYDSLSINNITISYKTVKGLDYLKLTSFFKLLFKPNRFGLKEIFNTDFVLDIAEGDSFTDIYGNDRFKRICNSKFFFKFLNKKQLLLPQTIGPFKDSKNSIKAIQALKGVDLVISRDRKSYDITKTLLPADRIKESIDVAFYMPFEKKQFANDKINVGINISGLLWNGGYNKKNQFELMSDYKKLMQDLIIEFLKIDNIQLHIVSHVLSLDPIEDDYQVAESIKKDFPMVIISPRFNSPIEAKSYISGLDFFTGARMHACIAAFSSGVPVVPLAYSRKFNGLFVDTLDYKYLADAVNHKNEEAFDQIMSGFINRTKLAEIVSERLQNIVTPRLHNLKKMIGDFLTS